MKFSCKVYFFFLSIYIISSSFLNIFHKDLIAYILNPVIWILLALIGYFVFYRNNKNYYPYRKEILYDVIISTILYIIVFYSFGFKVGFSNNAYSKEINGIIINLFSILMIVGIKEYIRNLLINEITLHKLFYQLIILFLFFLSDLNVSLIIETAKDINNLFDVVLQFIIPILSLNIFANYLCIKSGFLSSFIFRVGIIGVSLIIPIVPKYDFIIPTLFDVLIPLFTYLVIRYHISKKTKYKIEEPVKPSKWIPIFLIVLCLLMFSLGAFSIKPIVILTGSMKPGINEGDLLIIDKCEIKDVKVGDIIEYSMDRYTVVHRVIRILNGKNGIELIMKGDNNLQEDKKSVTEDTLVGCFRYHIPYLGYPAYLVHQILHNQTVDVETGR